MNILEAEDIIKGLPDQSLMQEAQAPSGQVPQFLVVSEIQRRTDMRKRYEEQQPNQGTVKDQILQQGIMSAMPPQMPAGMPPQMPAGMPPQGMPPQQMFSGGIIRLREGGSTSPYERAKEASAPYKIQAGDTPSKVARMFGVSVDELLAHNEPLLGGRFDAGTVIRNPREKEMKVKAAYQQGVPVEQIARAMRMDPTKVLSLLSGAQDDSGSGQMGQLSPVEVTAQRKEPDMGLMSLSSAMQERPEFAYPPLQEVSVDAQRIEPMVQPSASTFATMPKMSETIPPASLRIADSLGFFDDMKEDARQRNAISNLPAEPMASAIANKLADRYMVSEDDFATARQMAQLSPVEVTAQRRQPDMSLLSPVEVMAQRKDLPDQSSEGLASLGAMTGILPPEYDQQVAERRAGFAEFFDSLSDQFAENRARDREFLNRRSAPTSAPESKAANVQGDSPMQAQAVSGRGGDPILENILNRELVDPYMPSRVLGDEPIKPELAQEEAPDPIRTALDALTGAPGPDASNPKRKPSLDLADLIAESKKAGMANALMQLGAGIAGGDLSKGISAAGIAATKGQQDAKAIAMRQRLAEYQAGREDIAREDKAKEFKKTFGLSKRKVDALIEQNADTTQREILRTLVSLFEGESYPDKKAKYAQQIQDMLREIQGLPVNDGLTQGVNNNDPVGIRS